MEGYNVTIESCTKELTARERIAIKDTGNAIKIDDVAPCEISPDYYAELNIHNDKAKGDKDYKCIVIVDKNGQKFVTGSPSFKQAFEDIFTEMLGESEPWAITAYKLDSKNYSGKKFLTCSIV